MRLPNAVPDVYTEDQDLPMHFSFRSIGVDAYFANGTCVW